MGPFGKQPAGQVPELTAAGRRRLREEILGWKRYAAAVFKVVEAG